MSRYPNSNLFGEDVIIIPNDPGDAAKAYAATIALRHFDVIDELLNTFAVSAVNCASFAAVNSQGARPRWMRDAIDERTAAADAIVAALLSRDGEIASQRDELSRLRKELADMTDKYLEAIKPLDSRECPACGHPLCDGEICTEC